MVNLVCDTQFFFPNSFGSLPVGTNGSLTLDQMGHWQPDLIFCKIYFFSHWTFFSFMSCPFSSLLIPFSMQINWKGYMPNSTLDKRVTSPKKGLLDQYASWPLKFLVELLCTKIESYLFANLHGILGCEFESKSLKIVEVYLWFNLLS